VDERPVTRYAKTVDGFHIAYQVQGPGPLRLLAGSGEGVGLDSGDDEPSFLRFQRRLASFSTVTRFNPRGLGLSDPVPGGPATPDQQVLDAIAVLDEVESERAAVFAFAAGVPQALLLAVKHPERISHLVVVHGFARMSRAPDYPAGVPQRLLDWVAETVVELTQSIRVLTFSRSWPRASPITTPFAPGGTGPGIATPVQPWLSR